MSRTTSENMLGVIFDNTEKSKPKIDSDRSLFYIPYYKDEEYFSSYENEIAFYKGVESLVRKHAFYSKYIRYLIEVVGINTCQVLSNIPIEDKSKVTIEMHHGPILTLFDIAMIVTTHLRKQGFDKITTPYVADLILEEHRLNHVRVVLVSKSVHQKIHEDEIILNYRQGFGDTGEFLEKYHDGLSNEMKVKINQYIDWSMKNDSYDHDVFKLSEKMKRWGNNDLDLEHYNIA